MRRPSVAAAQVDELARYWLLPRPLEPCNDLRVVLCSPAAQELLGVVVARVRKAARRWAMKAAVSGWAQSTSMQ
ncbi:hypothetical protein IA54_015550 [Xanthomonas phaseoli pv. syngonii LMG 9055]|uniref:Uncharacterized protein n=1 Tax=Xanthomonas phaseoli pv. syngonii LMG 9055 TaxID=1437878 RepID=A0A1V9GL12_9XANT|nr:hypothetical protein IA54_015550 [Xanthomonas phaseoli pv. syngonii LMG 9055]